MDPEILTPRFLPCRAMCPYPCAFSLHFCLLGVMEMLWKGDARHGRCVVQVSQPVPPPRVVTPATLHLQEILELNFMESVLGYHFVTKLESPRPLLIS